MYTETYARGVTTTGTTTLVQQSPLVAAASKLNRVCDAMRQTLEELDANK